MTLHEAIILYTNISEDESRMQLKLLSEMKGVLVVLYEYAP